MKSEMWRKKPLDIFVGFLFFLIVSANSVSILAQNRDSFFEPNEVVIKLTQTSELPAIAAQYGLNPTPICQLGNKPLYRMQILESKSVSEVVNQLQNDREQRVIYAEPNYLIGSPSQSKLPWSLGLTWSIGGGTLKTDSNVKTYSRQWMSHKIGLATAHSFSRGQGIKIAVLDTGIDYHHPVFANKLLPGYDYVDYDYYAGEVGIWGQGAYGHGTAVAGVIAVVAPEAKIIPIRVLDADGVGNIWRLAEGLKFAANPDNNIYTNDGADIINLSLGTVEPTSLIKDLLSETANNYQLTSNDYFSSTRPQGVVIIAAAGNTGDLTPIYPAAEEVNNLVAVAASTSNDVLTHFSTRGDWIDVMAPGERIISATPNGGFASWRGTSFSAPIVSGIAALVMVMHPNMNPNQVADHVKGTSADVIGANFLRVDANRALTITPVLR